MMYKLAHVDDSNLSVCKGIMQDIYKEEPSYWPHGLSVVGHDDMYLIREKSANSPIGFIGFQKISESNGDLIGWYTVGIKPEFRKKGYAKEAIQTMLAEKHPEVKEVKAMVMNHNAPSKELASSLNIPTRIKSATLQFALDAANQSIETEKEFADSHLDNQEKQLKLREQEMKIQEHANKGQERADKLVEKEEKRQEKEEKRQEKNQKSIADATKALAQQEQDRVDKEKEQEETDQLEQEQEDEKILMEQQDFNSRLPASLQPKGSGGGGIQIKGDKGIYANMPGNNMKMEQEKPQDSGRVVAAKIAKTIDSLRVKKAGLGRSIIGGGLGLGASEWENKNLLPESSPELHRINNAIGALSGAVIGRGGRGATSAALSWPFKQMGLLSTGEAQNYIKGQEELADTNLEAARAQERASASSASAAGTINKSVIALIGAAGVGALGIGGYKLYEYVKKQQKKKKRGVKGDTTIRGKANRKRHKVKIDIPAESLPPEFWKSLVNVDDAPNSRMKAPKALLKAKAASARWYKDTDLLDNIKLAGGVGDLAYHIPNVIDQTLIRPPLIPPLRAIQNSTLYKALMPDHKLIGPTYTESREGAGKNLTKLYDHQGEGTKRMLMQALAAERLGGQAPASPTTMPSVQSNPLATQPSRPLTMPS